MHNVKRKRNRHQKQIIVNHNRNAALEWSVIIYGGLTSSLPQHMVLWKKCHFFQFNTYQTKGFSFFTISKVQTVGYFCTDMFPCVGLPNVLVSLFGFKGRILDLITQVICNHTPSSRNFRRPRMSVRILDCLKYDENC